MGPKFIESFSIITEVERITYLTHLSSLKDIIISDEEDIDKLDECIDYMLLLHMNERDSRNMIKINKDPTFNNIKEENIVVAIDAVLNIYHLILVFKTAVIK